jgi:hypothetical protein
VAQLVGTNSAFAGYQQFGYQESVGYGNSSSFAHAFQSFQLASNSALATSREAT